MEELTHEDHAISMVAFDWFYELVDFRNRPTHEQIFGTSLIFLFGEEVEKRELSNVEQNNIQEIKKHIDDSIGKEGMFVFIGIPYHLNKEKKDGLGYLAGFLLNYLVFEYIRKHYDEKKPEVLLEYIAPDSYDKKQLCELFNETPQKIRQALELLSLKKLIKLDKKNNLVSYDLNKIIELLDM